MRLSRTGVAVLSFAALAFTGCSTLPEARPLVALEIETAANTQDG